MILMALVGEGNDTGDAVHFALTRELGAPRVRRVFVGFLPCQDARIRRLNIEARTRGSDENVTLVVGINTPAEADAMRNMGAVVCHPYRRGRVSAMVPVRPLDLMISADLVHPEHVLDAVEAYSECFTRRAAARKQRRTQGAA
ncbi:hypothetical protein [Enterovibrio norvegicus]|uniref:hypothetical protein n=1 Tax=Enterovibrio norvegicus TaxID=188144 RepID=UPI000C858A18|nr:hypothetical protein [Enterovibrio norvegicus]PMN73177.1 hypothetical protein BCT27_12605 [Enterovibrio norvegicus]